MLCRERRRQGFPGILVREPRGILCHLLEDGFANVHREDRNVGLRHGVLEVHAELEGYDKHETGRWAAGRNVAYLYPCTSALFACAASSRHFGGRAAPLGLRHLSRRQGPELLQSQLPEGRPRRWRRLSSARISAGGGMVRAPASRLERIDERMELSTKKILTIILGALQHALDPESRLVTASTARARIHNESENKSASQKRE